MSKSLRRIQMTLTRTALAASSRVCTHATGRYLARRFVTPDRSSHTRAAEAIATMAPIQRQTVIVNGFGLETYVFGQPERQPHVLLGHGWSSYALRLANWIPRLLEQGYAVVTFDQRAHGLSEGDTSCMPHFVDALHQVGRLFGVPAAYIGHSMGAASIPFAVGPDWCPGRFVLLAPMVIPGAIARRRFELAKLSPHTFKPFEDWLFEHVGARFADFDSRPLLPTIARPALIIHDRRDRETPWEDGQLWAQLWPGARLITTEGLGHNRLIDDPAVMEQAMAFIGYAPTRAAQTTGW